MMMKLQRCLRDGTVRCRLGVRERERESEGAEEEGEEN
jgi:hypothetical protein